MKRNCKHELRRHTWCVRTLTTKTHERRVGRMIKRINRRDWGNKLTEIHYLKGHSERPEPITRDTTFIYNYIYFKYISVIFL